MINSNFYWLFNFSSVALVLSFISFSFIQNLIWLLQHLPFTWVIQHLLISFIFQEWNLALFISDIPPCIQLGDFLGEIHSSSARLLASFIPFNFVCWKVQCFGNDYQYFGETHLLLYIFTPHFLDMKVQMFLCWISWFLPRLHQGTQRTQWIHFDRWDLSIIGNGAGVENSIRFRYAPHIFYQFNWLRWRRVQRFYW